VIEAPGERKEDENVTKGRVRICVDPIPSLSRTKNHIAKIGYSTTAGGFKYEEMLGVRCWVLGT